MRGLLWLLIVFAVATGFALAALHHSGYVVMVYPPWRIELALSFFIVLLLLSLGVFYLLVRLVIGTLNIPASVRAHHARKHAEKTQQLLHDCLLAWFEQRYGKAEKLAAELLEQPQAPVWVGLLAAQAAHEQKAFERRDAYLAEMDDPDSEWAMPAAIMRTGLWQEQRHFAEALAEIQRVRRVARRNPNLIWLELRLQQQLKNWDSVLPLAQELAAHGGHDDTVLQQYQRHAVTEIMRRKADTPEDARQWWLRQPEAVRHDVATVMAVTQALLQGGACLLARDLLEAALQQAWNTQLAALYGSCGGDSPLPLIEKIEGWLRDHPQDAGLLRALGQLCLQAQLWGKAEQYLQHSLTLADDPVTRVALARLQEQQGRPQAACEHYRAALEARIED